MIVIKYIFMFLIGLYALDKIVAGFAEEGKTSTHKIVNLLEMAISVILVFIIYKL